MNTPKWNKVSPDCLPEEGRPLWVVNVADSIWLYQFGLTREIKLNSTDKYWLYCEGNYRIPEPPSKDEPKKARELWIAEYQSGKPAVVLYSKPNEYLQDYLHVREVLPIDKEQRDREDAMALHKYLDGAPDALRATASQAYNAALAHCRKEEK